jgi:transcriptional regulator with XRE-family HTH domain
MKQTMPISAPPHRESFGQRLERLCHEKSISRIELGRRIGVTGPAISQFVHGARTPRLDTVARIAGALGIRPELLLKDIAELHLENG